MGGCSEPSRSIQDNIKERFNKLKAKKRRSDTSNATNKSKRSSGISVASSSATPGIDDDSSDEETVDPRKARYENAGLKRTR